MRVQSAGLFEPIATRRAQQTADTRRVRRDIAKHTNCQEAQVERQNDERQHRCFCCCYCCVGQNARSRGERVRGAQGKLRQASRCRLWRAQSICDGCTFLMRDDAHWQATKPHQQHALRLTTTCTCRLVVIRSTNDDETKQKNIYILYSKISITNELPNEEKTTR